MDQAYFKTRYSYDLNRRRVWRAISEYLQRFIPTNSTVLDIGAGYCDLINQIQGARKYALDLNPEVAQFCAQDVQFLCGDSEALLELPRHSVDVVIASNFLEHLSDHACSNLFARLEHVLKEGGRLIVIQPNYYYCYRRYWDDFTHVKAF